MKGLNWCRPVSARTNGWVIRAIIWGFAVTQFKLRRAREWLFSASLPRQAVAVDHAGEGVHGS